MREEPLRPADGPHNVRQLYFDILWFGVASGSTLAFLPVYAARLGGSSLQVALLTAIPATVNLLLSLPAARWIEGRSLWHVAVWGLLINRPTYLLFILLPWLFASQAQVWALVTLTGLMAISGSVHNIAFNAMFADIVRPELRAEVVGRRNALLAISMLVTSLLCGWLLHQIAFPLNYQFVFTVGLVGMILSTVYVARIRHSQPPARPRPAAPPLNPASRLNTSNLPGAPWAPGLRRPRRSLGRPLLRLDLLRGPFGLFIFGYLMFYVFQATPVAVLPLFWVTSLHLSDATISVGHAFFQCTMLLSSLALAPLSRRVGLRRPMIVSTLLNGAYPLINGLARGPGVFLLASAMGGAVWGTANPSLVTRLFDRVPREDRPAHMALFNVVVNLGGLGGSLLGPALAGGLGLRDALLAAAGLRVLAGLLLWRFG